MAFFLIIFNLFCFSFCLFKGCYSILGGWEGGGGGWRVEGPKTLIDGH